MSSQARRTGQQFNPDSSHAPGQQVPPQQVSPWLQQCALFPSPQGGPNWQQTAASAAEKAPGSQQVLPAQAEQHRPLQQV
jgi:hypothetical protein